MGWQLIDSAKPGQEVDLWVRHRRILFEERITNCRFTGTHWEMRCDERGWTRLSAETVPTHWQPLPEPPHIVTEVETEA